jgi:bifunctional non-homologous end joining protein LigD
MGRYSSLMAVPRTDGFIDPCIPTLGAKPPSGTDWVHEIKHDGYRLIVRRDATTVRLFTRRGHDWTDRYPAIAGGVAKLRALSFTLDREAVVCGAEGVAVFDAIRRGARPPTRSCMRSICWSSTARNLRPLPLSKRKENLGSAKGMRSPVFRFWHTICSAPAT